MINYVLLKEENRVVAHDYDKEVGFCKFTINDNCLNVISTEVNELYQGQGIARKLVEMVIESAKEFGYSIMADCSYAKKIISK